MRCDLVLIIVLRVYGKERRTGNGIYFIKNRLSEKLGTRSRDGRCRMVRDIVHCVIY